MTFFKKIFGSAQNANFDTGMNYFMSGQFQEAVDVFDKLIANNPKDHESFYYKGECLMALGKHKEALSCFDEAMNLNKKDNLLSPFCKAKCLEITERLEEALNLYKKIANENRGESNNMTKSIVEESFYRMGMIFMKLRKDNEAVEAFSSVLEINPKNDNAFTNRAGVRVERIQEAVRKGQEYNKSDQVEAYMDYAEALSINPDNALANYGMGYLHFGVSKPKEALPFLEKVPPESPLYKQAQSLKEACLKETNEN